MARDKKLKHTDFDNQKQLRLGQEQEELVHLSGDESRDDRDEAGNEVSTIDVQPMLGYPFMHPMHDASADQQIAPRALRHNAKKGNLPKID